MECSIWALVACFSWSNFYVMGGLSVNDGDVYAYHESVSHHFDGAVLVGESRAVSERRMRRNPFGTGAIGYEIEFSRRVSLNIELFRHTSSLRTGEDRGVNSAGLYLTVHPFR